MFLVICLTWQRGDQQGYKEIVLPIHKIQSSRPLPNDPDRKPCYNLFFPQKHSSIVTVPYSVQYLTIFPHPSALLFTSPSLAPPL
jgi:hypothetical protein